DPVPVLDPTVATWTEELERARDGGRARLVKWLPGYGRYQLETADACAAAVARAGLGLIVQIRLEDPRRQPPGAVVVDTDPAAVVDLARRHPGLTTILGGAAWTAIRQHGPALRELPNLYADVSQADGMDTLRLFEQEGLIPKLLFATHAPFFVPLAGLARVLTDLEDGPAAAVLGGNAAALLGR
ncbi:MAG: amidohydrolase family protein, partial [Gemmatimonadota bacterium]